MRASGAGSWGVRAWMRGRRDSGGQYARGGAVRWPGVECSLREVALLVLVAGVCWGQEMPVGGYFRDAAGALRELRGVEGAWTAAVVVPEGVLSAGYSGRTLWYKTAERLYVRERGGEWAEAPVPPGPAQGSFDASGGLAEVHFPGAGLSARWESAQAELGSWRAASEAPAAEQIAPGLFLMSDGPLLLAWRAGLEPVILPLADPSPLRLFLREPGGGEVPVTDPFTFAPAAPGESRDAQLRLRNAGATQVTVARLSVDVGAFRLPQLIQTPLDLPAGGSYDFLLRFTPPGPGEYAATLYLNDVRVGLRGAAAGGTVVELEDSGGWRVLVPGASAELGSVERGAVLRRRLRLTPAAAATLTGAKFTLAPTGDPAIFELTFSSELAGAATAELIAGSSRYTLRAVATEYVLPRPSIPTPPASLEPAAQQKVLIRLSEPARGTVLGSATLVFAPRPGLPDEPAIAFLPQMVRTLPLQFAAGASEAELTIQTGTTAGALTVQVTVGAASAEVRFTLPARPLKLTAARANLADGVILTGYDNTRSAATVAFTWYLKSGQTAAPGRMEIDIAERFREYFAQNPGGVFQLRARFPISGTATELEGVEVELSSEEGTVRTGRVRLE